MKTDKHKNPKSLLKNARKASVDRLFLESLRKNLVLYMEKNPVAAREIPEAGPIHIWKRFAGVAFAGLILTMTAGGTAFASQNSLPGDLLYPVKILSEQMRVTTSFTPEARSHARLKFAQNRVDEALALAQKNANGSNEKNYRASLQTALNNFNAQISAAFGEAQNLKEKNDTAKVLEITSDIKAATDVYKEVLSGEKEKIGDSAAQDFDEFIASNNNFNARADSEIISASAAKKNSSDESSVANDINIAQERINEAKRAIESNKAAVPIGFSARAESDIEKAQSKLENAQNHFDNKEFEDAASSTNDSVLSANSAQSLINAATNLNSQTVIKLNERSSRNENKNDEEHSAIPQPAASGVAVPSAPIINGTSSAPRVQPSPSSSPRGSSENDSSSESDKKSDEKTKSDSTGDNSGTNESSSSTGGRKEMNSKRE